MRSELVEFAKAMQAGLEELDKRLGAVNPPAPADRKWPVGTWLVSPNDPTGVCEVTAAGIVWRTELEDGMVSTMLPMEFNDWLPGPPRPTVPGWRFRECRRWRAGERFFDLACGCVSPYLTEHDSQGDGWGDLFGWRRWIAEKVELPVVKTLAAWKAEFYPVEAKDVAAEDALAHSLRKWKGLRKENLERHGVRCEGSYITDGQQSLYIDTTSCALCCQAGAMDGTDHAACLGVKATGRRCDLRRASPWSAWRKSHDPEPMIAWLEEAIEKSKPTPLTGEAWLTAHCTRQNAGMMLWYKGEWFVVMVDDEDEDVQIRPALRPAAYGWYYRGNWHDLGCCFPSGIADLSDATVEVRPAPGREQGK